jgi:uncharacterized glyoxalase superfamily protein PhnB
VSQDSQMTATRLVPTLRYRDVGAAIEWLCTAFGFEAHRVVAGVDGTILHAHLTFGNDLIMLLPVRASDLDKVAEASDGADMQSCYFVVDDADRHHRAAKAAGADILDIMQYDLGGRGYSCRDPEGHIWNFGTYNPRQRKPAPVKPAYDPWVRVPGFRNRVATTSLAAARLRDKARPTVIVTVMVAAVVSAATVGWMLVALPQTGAGGKDKRLVSTAQRAEGATEQAARPASEPAHVRGLVFGTMPGHQRVADADEPAAPRTPERAAAPGTTLAVVHAARPAPEPDQEQVSKDAAERAAQEALRQWRAAQETLRQLSRQRSAREAAAHAQIEARKQLDAARETPPRDTRRPSAEERAAKEPAKRAGKEAPKPLIEEPRPQTNAVAPAKDPRQSPERKADEPVWDCLPSPTGQVVCRQQEQRPASVAGVEPAAPRARMSAVGPAAAVGPAPDVRPSPEQNAGEQVWDCRPHPTTGQVACHPIPGPSKR